MALKGFQIRRRRQGIWGTVNNCGRQFDLVLNFRQDPLAEDMGLRGIHESCRPLAFPAAGKTRALVLVGEVTGGLLHTHESPLFLLSIFPCFIY